MIKLNLFLIGLILPFALQAKPCKKITQALLDLYPEQTKEQMLVRLKNAKNKHKFMRAFIPYYYEQGWAVRKEMAVYERLNKHVGVIGGDCHVQNFGFMVNNKGVPILTLNDFDDVARGPIFMDVIRLSQSASYVDDINMSKLLQAYRKGLSGGKYDLSEYMQKLSKKAAAGGFNHKAEITTTNAGPRFAVKQEPFFATTQKELSSIKKHLAGKFGNDVIIHDTYRTMKESGGSAFGKRFHVLMEKDGQFQMVEFKEIQKGGVTKEWMPKVVSDFDRVTDAQNTLLGKDFSHRLYSVQLDETPMQVRFKAKGNKSVDPFAAASEKESMQIIQDEFFALGQMHRNSLGNDPMKITAYIKDFDKVDVKDWEQSMGVMKEVVKKAYNKTSGAMSKKK